LSIKHWRHAANLLQAGTIARWLQQTARDQDAAAAAEQATRRWSADPDAALDEFIRRLEPSALPPGELDLRTTNLRLHGVKPGQKSSQRIEIRNKGRGYLRGQLDSTQSWVKTGGSFGCPPGQSCTVPIEIDTSGLLAGQPYLAAVTLQPSNGIPEVVAIQVTIADVERPPVHGASGKVALKVRPDRIDFGSVSAKRLSTPGKQFSVTNVGDTRIRVRISGGPRWLLIQPETFELTPGANQVIKLVGRISKVEGRKQDIRLAVTPDGGPGQEVRVLLKIKRGGLFG
jgi:hypothetical protein